MFISEGIPARSWKWLGSQRRERRNALAQCRKASLTSTRIASLGARSLKRMLRASQGRSPDAPAVHPQRVVKARNDEEQPDAGVGENVGEAVEPVVAGAVRDRQRVRVEDRTNPAGSPRGLTSAFPSRSCVPMHRKGERRIKSCACLSSALWHFKAASACVGWNRVRRECSSLRVKSSLSLYSVIGFPFEASFWVNHTQWSSPNSMVPTRSRCARLDVGSSSQEAIRITA